MFFFYNYIKDDFIFYFILQGYFYPLNRNSGHGKNASNLIIEKQNAI